MREWAATRPDVRAVALVGSWAREEAGPGSDLDLVVLTDDPGAYLGSDAWTAALGGELVATRSWGVLVERRLRTPDGLELDVGIAAPSWASTSPVDPGTVQVVSGGMRPLYDPDDLLARLQWGI